MPLRSALTRLAMVTAAGALATTAAVAPALADDWDGDGGGNNTQSDDSYDWLGQGGQGGGDGGDGGGGQNEQLGNQNGQGNQNGHTGQGNQAGQGNQSSQSSQAGQGHQNSQGNQAGQSNQHSQDGQNGLTGQGNQNGQSGTWQSGGGTGGDGGAWQSGHQNDSRHYRGRVTASELLLRSAPNRGGQVIRVARRGEIVSIFCRTPGQNVQGNPVWYLLTDGTWAWGAARYIDVIGATPRWC
ncbi:hypothetical protein GCM10010269_44820 [Streptomyces humidus]|uniref:SH3b domain-containing protein n=1 Tax=Streptomyces humidus TaxID=52259 RepID=A0A918L4M6_9ACTN|nr:SH3 domain-containing protein [Streptomyces humidus]GGS00886.1 hypothetical protein GCM10010269_44820 [Streptomyces humidus]